MLTPRKYIENIKNRYLNSDKEFALDSIAGLIDKIKKAFPRYGSFLMEFVQNADDAESQSLKIEILQNTIKIFNDGVTFSEENVKSICKGGCSSKTAKDYIGYLGVGFKSVFLISESPEIYSGDFRFKFDKNDPCWDDPTHTPWQVMPLWIDNPQVEFSEKYKTIFNLPLKQINLLEKLREEVKPEHLSDRTLLFLRNVKEIRIADTNQNFERKIIKSELSKTSNYEIYQIQEYENDVLKNQDRWLIFRSSCTVPKEVKEDDITKDWERENVDKREVLVAFRLGEEDNLIVEEKGTAYIGVHSFTPLKEIKSGLNFLIQGDFLATIGKGELIRGCLWNEWITDEIYKLIIDKCTSTFLNHEKWRMNFTEVLYSSEEGHELFAAHIKEPLRKYLERNSVLIAEKGLPAKAEELVSMGEEIKELLKEEDLQILFPNKKSIHKDCKPHHNLKIEEGPNNIYEFLDSSISDELMKHKAELKDVQWFKKLYSMLVDRYDLNYFREHYYRYYVEHDNFWNRMRNFHKPIMLTKDCGIAKINECYTNPNKVKIPEQIKDKFKIVHPELSKDEKINELKKKLNIEDLTEEDIKNALKKQEILELDEEKWINLSEDEKIEKIKHLKESWVAGYLPLEGYTFLTLKSKTIEWVKPELLFFSKEYNPEHNLEIISNEKKLYDKPLNFISTEFIKNESDDEIKKWYKFFKELGVDKKLDDKNFRKNMVQRIGILTALNYERSKGRIPHELSRSEETGGYDIEQSQDEVEEGYGLIQSEERYIEVKSSKSPNPDIFLTTKQLDTLKNKQEKYFVYVVKDALRYPTLCVTRGDKLLAITEIKTIIPFNKWFNEAKYDEFQP